MCVCEREPLMPHVRSQLKIGERYFSLSNARQNVIMYPIRIYLESFTGSSLSLGITTNLVLIKYLRTITVLRAAMVGAIPSL